MGQHDLKNENIKVVIHTDRYKIQGEIPVYEGISPRLSDLLNDGKPFLNLINTEIYQEGFDAMLYKVDFICINKTSIVFIFPEK